MTTTATAVRTHVVTGHPTHVNAALRRAALDGRLAGLRDPMTLPDHRVRVTADLREPTRPRFTFPTDSWRWLRPVLLGLLVVALAGGVVWCMVLLVQALIAAVAALGVWVAAKLPLIIAIGVVLVLLAVPAGARCVGMHCGGCRR